MYFKHAKIIQGSAILVVLVLSLLTACGGGGESGSSPSTNNSAVPASTAVGIIDINEIGSEKSIGAGGDTLSTLDSKITLTVPPGALATDTPLSIQRITNTAHGGIGGSFRLEPNGQTFSQPVTLTFTYTDADLAGSDPVVLGAAFQTADGHWQWLGTPVVDAANRTISVSTTHFTDFSMVKGFQIRPASKTIQTNATAALRVVYCYEPSVGYDALQPLGYNCDGSNDDLAPLLPTADVSNWSVNGVAGGNSTVGTVSGSSTTATYHAPATVPGVNPVAVSAQVARGSGTATVVSNITITTAATSYTGTVEYSSTSPDLTDSYSAAITWTEFNDGDDTIRSYTPSVGPLSVTRSVTDCAPITVSAPLMTDTGNLVVHTASHATTPNTYQFMLVSEQVDLTYNCLNGTYVVPTQFVIAVGGCNPNDFPGYSVESNLSGTYSCNTYNSTVNWNFNAP